MDEFRTRLMSVPEKLQAKREAENVVDGPLFSRKQASSKFSPVSPPITRQALDGVVDRTTVINGIDRQTVVVVDRFKDLPTPVLEAAKNQKYDNTTSKERIPRVFHDGKIYLVHENISSELVAEETLLHERVHQALNGSL